MEKICLARRRWQSNEMGERDEKPSVASWFQPPSITVRPDDMVRSLVHSLSSIGNKEHDESGATTQKFEVEIQYDCFSPIKVTVHVAPARPQTDKQWLTVEETARFLRVSPATIYKELWAGNLAGLRVGRQWRVFMPGLDKEVREETR